MCGLMTIEEAKEIIANTTKLTSDVCRSKYLTALKLLMSHGLKPR